MKKIFLFLFLAASITGFSQDNPMFSLHLVRVEGDLAAFEQVQKIYMQKVAQDAVDKGDISFWGFFKTYRLDGVDDEEIYNYLFIQGSQNVDALLSDKAAWWNNAPNVLTKKEQEMVESLSEKFTWVKDGRHVFAEEAGIGRGLGAYIQFNFATPKNLNGFITENQTLWHDYFDANMADMGMINWGVGRRIAPLSKDWSPVVTWDMFDTLASLMKFRVGVTLPEEIVSTTKMSEYNPNGWNASVIFENLIFAVPAQD